MAEYRLVVQTNPVAGQEAAFNSWYDDPHLGDVLTVEGFTRAQRFVLADHQINGMTASRKYLAIYEFQSDDLEATLKRFLEICAAKMMITPSLAPDALPIVYEVLGPPKIRE